MNLKELRNLDKEDVLEMMGLQTKSSTAAMTPCGHCDYCIGKETLPADCATDGGTPYNCPTGYIACGQYGIDPTMCPTDTTCVTGCCRPIVP